LTYIESKAFLSCSSLKSFTNPLHVQILCSYCFSYCKLHSSISFDPESELARIEVDAFYSTFLSSVFVLQNTSFVTGGAFPRKCVVRYGRRRCRIQWRAEGRWVRLKGWIVVRSQRKKIKSRTTFIMRLWAKRGNGKVGEWNCLYDKVMKK
jgi:hypothetical protein